jgi:hypothetical protein
MAVEADTEASNPAAVDMTPDPSAKREVGFLYQCRCAMVSHPQFSSRRWRQLCSKSTSGKGPTLAYLSHRPSHVLLTRCVRRGVRVSSSSLKGMEEDAYKVPVM